MAANYRRLILSSHPTPITFVRETCGSDLVTRDAWAEWDAAAQASVLGAADDDAFCQACGEATHLREFPFAPVAEGVAE